MAKLEEIRDGWSGNVLVADREAAAATTSEQSGDTFCYEKDFDVFDDFGRYEQWQDLYPEVSLRICGEATGEVTGVGTFVFIAPPELFVDFLTVQLPGDLQDGGFPETVNLSDAPPEETYIINNIVIALYDFEIGVTNVAGILKSLSQTVNFSDLFQDLDGNPTTFPSYTLTYRPAYAFGFAPLHSLVSSVHPLKNVDFPDLTPVNAPRDDYSWYQYLGQSLRIEGTGDHHPLERNSADEYAGHASGGAGAAAGILVRQLHRSTWAGRLGEYVLGQRLPDWVYRRSRSHFVPHILGASLAGAHIGANYIRASNGYLIGNLEVLPRNGARPALIQLVVGLDNAD